MSCISVICYVCCPSYYFVLVPFPLFHFYFDLSSTHRNTSEQEKIFLRAVVSEFQRLGLEEAEFSRLYDQHTSLCRLESMCAYRGSILKGYLPVNVPL